MGNANVIVFPEPVLAFPIQFLAIILQRGRVRQKRVVEVVLLT